CRRPGRRLVAQRAANGRPAPVPAPTTGAGRPAWSSLSRWIFMRRLPSSQDEQFSHYWKRLELARHRAEECATQAHRLREILPDAVNHIAMIGAANGIKTLEVLIETADRAWTWSSTIWTGTPSPSEGRLGPTPTWPASSTPGRPWRRS